MQTNTREDQLGSHTVQSHGIILAKTHTLDWIILFILLALMIILGLVHPFYRFVGKDMMVDLKYPHKSSTVPFWAVPIVAVILPVAVFLAFYFRRRDVYDLHHAILGILFSVLITGVLTNAIKDAVGRPRPDFFWRCFPDGKELYDQVTGRVICHGKKSLLNAGHKSFPSGHTSWAFAGLSFFALYLSGKIKVFDRRGHVAKLCIIFLPLLIASLVGISRVDDYRHHWEDVFAGGILGMIVAMFCYLQFFPPPYHINGWGPHAYFQMLESLGSTNILPGTQNQQSEERSGSTNISPITQNQQSDERSNVGPSGVRHNGSNSNDGNNAGPSGIRYNGSNLDDLESGRMQRKKSRPICCEYLEIST